MYKAKGAWRDDTVQDEGAGQEGKVQGEGAGMDNMVHGEEAGQYGMVQGMGAGLDEREQAGTMDDSLKNETDDTKDDSIHNRVQGMGAGLDGKVQDERAGLDKETNEDMRTLLQAAVHNAKYGFDQIVKDSVFR